MKSILFAASVATLCVVGCKSTNSDSQAKDLVPTAQDASVLVNMTFTVSCGQPQTETKPLATELGLKRCFDNGHSHEAYLPAGKQSSPDALAREMLTPSLCAAEPKATLYVTCEIDGSVEPQKYNYSLLSQATTSIPTDQIYNLKPYACMGADEVNADGSPVITKLQACEVRGFDYSGNAHRIIEVAKSNDYDSCEIQGRLAAEINAARIQTTSMICSSKY